MASRAIGALLALAAVAAFVVSIATSTWWTGHPTIEGHFTTAKDVHVGLLGGEGCNTGGDGSCESIELDDTVTLVMYGELGATGLATLLLLATAIAALSISDNRKGLSTASILTTLVAAGGAGAVLMLGPGIKASQTVEVPLGWGLYVFGGGVGAALLAAIVTRRLEREPLRLKPSNAPLLQPAAVDVRQMLGRPSTPAPAQPEPQLRPLYENAGVAPIPTQPVLPTRSPTPMPREQIEQLTGKPMSTMPMPERDTKLAGMPPEVRKKPPSAAPPPSPQPSPLPGSMSSTLPGSMSSPLPSPSSSPGPSPGPSPIPRTNPPRTKPPSASPPPSPGKPAASPSSPPGKQPAASLSQPGAKQPRAKTLQSGGEPAVKRPSLPPAPKVPMPAPRPSQPTMTHAVPPMPTADNQPAPAVLPAHRSDMEDGDGELDTGMMPAQRASTESDDRLETAMRATEHITAVEIDHEAKARAQHAKATPRSDTDARTGKQRTTPAVGDITDVGVEAAPPASIMTDRALTTEQREVARAPTDDPFENQRARSIITPIHGAPVSETLPAQRLSALFPAEDVPDEGPRGEDLMQTIEQNPKTPVPTIVAREQQSAERPATQVPMSTAPTSLPPPKNLNVETMPSGPTPACPQCESPMAWVEEHLRFYCKSCRMYF